MNLVGVSIRSVSAVFFQELGLGLRQIHSPNFLGIFRKALYYPQRMDGRTPRLGNIVGRLCLPVSEVTATYGAYNLSSIACSLLWFGT